MNHNFDVKAKDNSITGGVPLDTTLKVRPGDLLVITASPDDTWSLGEGDRVCNANGLSNPMGGSYGFYSNGTTSFLFGSLVGTFDEGKTYFGIGTYLAMTVLTKGILKFACWDGFSGDNSGSVNVTVQMYTGPRP